MASSYVVSDCDNQGILVTCGTVTILTQLANPIWRGSNLSSDKVDHDDQSTVLVTSQRVNEVEMLIKKGRKWHLLKLGM